MVSPAYRAHSRVESAIFSRREAANTHSNRHCFMAFIFQRVLVQVSNKYSSDGIATGYGLDYWMIGVRFPAGAWNFSV
jgi:hypothetical protein